MFAMFYSIFTPAGKPQPKYYYMYFICKNSAKWDIGISGYFLMRGKYELEKY